jgi:hypothetical protein
MARYIDLSDKAKGVVQLRAARKVDWDLHLAECAARAEAVKAAGGRPNRVAMRLESLRTEYRSLVRARHFAQTGVNLSHSGLDN